MKLISFKKWTESETQILIQLKSNYVLNKDIALQLNRSVSSVRNKVLEVRNYTNIESLESKWTESETEMLIDLRNRNFSWKEVGESLNRSRDSCISKSKRL